VEATPAPHDRREHNLIQADKRDADAPTERAARRAHAASTTRFDSEPTPAMSISTRSPARKYDGGRIA
jgi:hypothetical protein